MAKLFDEALQIHAMVPSRLGAEYGKEVLATFWCDEITIRDGNWFLSTRRGEHIEMTCILHVGEQKLIMQGGVAK